MSQKYILHIHTYIQDSKDLNVSKYLSKLLILRELFVYSITEIDLHLDYLSRSSHCDTNPVSIPTSITQRYHHLVILYLVLCDTEPEHEIAVGHFPTNCHHLAD